MMHIKAPLLLIEKSISCSNGNGFPLSLSEWNFTICLTTYNRKCVECSLNRPFPSFLPYHFNKPFILLAVCVKSLSAYTRVFFCRKA